jgi:transcriptional regulator with XRE-family HTH domain
MIITPAQLRAARSLVGLSQRQIAEVTGLSVPTIKRAESETGLRVSRAAVFAIRNALETAGVIFLPEGSEGVGVRFRAATPSESMRPEQLNAANDD